MWSAQHCLPNVNITCHGVPNAARIPHAQTRLSLENLGKKCYLATLFLLINELAVIWYGRQVRKINSLFFLSYQYVGWFFAVSNCMGCFVPLSNNQMKTKMNVSTVVTKLRSGAFKWCMTSLLYINSFFVFSHLILCFSCEAAVWCSDGVK